MAESSWQVLLPPLWSLLSFLVAIVVLVAVHEWGHFWVARKVGVKVLRFSIGFGRPLWSWRDRAGTEYVIAGIPFGGYVKMLDEREGEVPEAELPFSFNRQPVSRRSLVVAAGPVANLVFAFLVFWMLFMGGEKGVSPEVGQVQAQSLAAQAGLMPGMEILSVDGVPTPTRDAVFSALVARIGDSGTLLLTAGSPGASTGQELQVRLDRWLSDDEEPDPIKGLGITFYYPPFVQVAGVVPGSVAERAGLQAGDVVERVDGLPVAGPAEWVDYIRARPGQSVRLGIRHEDGWREVEVVPARVEDPERGLIGQIGAQVGYVPLPASSLRHIDLGLIGAAERALEETGRQISLLVRSIYKLVVGDLSPKNLSGPLGIAKVTGASAGMGLAVFCQTLAVLSISLGIMNLLPIPMLDGGHLLVYLAEALKGGPVPERVQMLGNQIGMLVLISLMLFAIYNDILKFQ